MNTRPQVQARQNQAQNAPQASVTSDPIHDERDARMACLDDNLFRLTGALARIGGYEPTLEGIFGGGEQSKPRLNVKGAIPGPINAKMPRTQASEMLTADAPSACRVTPTYRQGALTKTHFPKTLAHTLLHTPTRPDGRPSPVSVAGKKWRTAKTRSGSTRPAASTMRGRQAETEISGNTSTVDERSQDANLPRGGQSLPTP